jgi:tetratricopeptide (TPR) repeat protein
MQVLSNIEARFQYAYSLHQQGRLAEAAGIYQSILAVDRTHSEALHWLGIIAHQNGHQAAAIDLISQSIAIAPGVAVAHFNFGIILGGPGRFEEAVASYDKAIALRPDFAEAYYNRGNALAALLRFEAAIASFDKAIALKPDFADAYYNRGNALAALLRFEAAIASFDNAIALKPDNAIAYDNRGTALVKLRRFKEAIADFDKAIALWPNHAEAHYNRGSVLKNLSFFEEAVASFDKAIALNSAYADAYVNRGNALTDLRRFEEAVVSFDKAIVTRPDFAEAYNNRGKALTDLRRFEDAVASFDKAIALNPHYANAYFNRANLELLTGDFAGGWRDYEWRESKPELGSSGKDLQRLLAWRYEIQGKSVLVRWEQGLGDTIQFCRYAELLQDAGAKVLFAPQARLIGLMASLSGSIELVDADDQSLSFDYQVPLMSLPLIFETNAETIPSKIPYLFASQDRVERWGDRIGGHGFKIGICWHGTSTFQTHRNRSFSVSSFEELAKISGVRLISLQKGDAEDQLRTLPPGMVVEVLGDDFDAGADAFLDTAAAMRCLDLVITSDTSIAHLAGALGVQTWVALQYVPDWRWMLDRSDSPWYPSMRLFRQATPGDWNSVFAQFRTVLMRAIHG